MDLTTAKIYCAKRKDLERNRTEEILKSSFFYSMMATLLIFYLALLFSPSVRHWTGYDRVEYLVVHHAG